jgi:hypothetical protein
MLKPLGRKAVAVAGRLAESWGLRGDGPYARPRRWFFGASAVLSAIAFSVYLWLSAGQPFWKRFLLFGWPFVLEALEQKKPNALQTFVIFGYVNGAATVLAVLKLRAVAAYRVVQLVFGVVSTWYTASFELTDSAALNALLLFASAWVVAEAVEGIYELTGFFQGGGE